LNKVVIFFYLIFFAYKKYSFRLINLRLSHYSHLDYFTHIFNNFSGPASFNPLEAIWRSDPALRFNQNYLNLCSEDERKSLRSWNNM